jgi:Holliday junction resolvase RusA-like endonuclease
VTARLSFTVAGTPIPQGSHRLINNRVIPDKRLVAWRQLVTAEALTAAEQADWETHDGPVVLRLQFYLPAPQKPRWWLPAVKPDLDKLARSIGDALAPKDPDQRVITDDSRIVELHAAKHYADDQNPPGVHVQIGTIA